MKPSIFKKKALLILLPWIVLLYALLSLGSSSCKKIPPENGLTIINIKDKKAYVELAITEEEHRQGLMFRERLGKDHGMLFIFPEERQVAFWMKNTSIPLSIAFIKEDGWIAQIEDMQPFSLENHISDFKVKYVLEMGKGWYKMNQINVGDFVQIPTGLTSRGQTIRQQRTD